MRAFSSALLAAVLVLPTAPVFADEDEENDWRRSGWYVSVNGTYNFENLSNVAGATVGDSLGAGLKAGWHFKQYFAVEGDFQWVNQFELKKGPYGGLGYRLWTFGLNGKAYLPFPSDPDSFWNRIQPFLLGGFGLQQSTPLGGARLGTGARFEDFDSSGSFYGRMGGGLDLYFTRNWGLGLEASYLIPVSHASVGQTLSYTAVSWNFMYRF